MPASSPPVDSNVLVTSGFESGIGNWSTGTQASAAVQSTDQAHEGTNSLKITRSATSPGNYLVVPGSTDAPVVASVDYVLDYWLYTTIAAGSFRIDTDWYTSGQVYISTATGSSVSTASSAWTHAGPFTITSASTAAFARPALIHISGMTTGDVVYLDQVFLGRRIWATTLQLPQTTNRASGR